MNYNWSNHSDQAQDELPTTTFTTPTLTITITTSIIQIKFKFTNGYEVYNLEYSLDKMQLQGSPIYGTFYPEFCIY